MRQSRIKGQQSAILPNMFFLFRAFGRNILTQFMNFSIYYYRIYFWTAIPVNSRQARYQNKMEFYGYHNSRNHHEFVVARAGGTLELYRIKHVNTFHSLFFNAFGMLDFRHSLS